MNISFLDTVPSTSSDSSLPLVSLVLLNYNSNAFLEPCLSSVLRTKYPRFELIFVDNGSSDSSVATAMRLLSGRESCEIIQNSRNVGFAEGNNIGATKAKGKYVLFLNVDTEVVSDWLIELVKTLEADDRIGAAQGKLFLSRNKTRLDSVGHYVDYTGVESMDSAALDGAFDDGTHGTMKQIFYARGACLITRTFLFRSIGGFDPKYFTDHEEIDLCWRIQLAGYKVVYVPRAIVYHFRGGASWATRRQSPSVLLFHLRKNHIMSLIKNYEFRNVVRYLPRYLLYLIFHGLYRLTKSDSITIRSYVHAIVWVIANLKYVYAQRLYVQSRVREVPDRVVMENMTAPAIPFYFLK